MVQKNILTKQQRYLQNNDTYRRTKIITEEQKFYRRTLTLTEEYPQDGRFICSSVQLPTAFILRGITQ